MAKVKQIEKLPQAVKSELDQALINQGFGGYDDLCKFLAEKGYSISRSSIARYGKVFKERFEAITMATEQAKALVEATHDDENALNDAVIKLAQQRLFDVLINLEDTDNEKISKITRAIADVSRSSVQQKQYLQNYKNQLKKDIASEIKKSGLSEEDTRKTLNAVYGIIDNGKK